MLERLDLSRFFEGVSGRRLAAAAAAALLLAALGVYARSVLKLDPMQSYQLSYAPWPDGPELLDAALSLVRDGTYTIQLAGQSHPPRYPFGFSLLTAAAIQLGAHPVSAVYRLNQATGLLLLLTVFLLLARRKARVAAGLAALFLACLPAFVILCRSPKSEAASALLCLISIALLYDCSRRGGAWRLALGALGLGLSVCLRLSNALLAPFVPLAWLAGRRYGDPIFNWTAALGPIAYLAGIAPLLLYNHFTFGSPLRTGYSYWLPPQSGSLDAFGFQYLGAQLGYLWSEFTQSEILFTTANLYGEGSYFGPAFAVLGLVSLNWFAGGKRRVLFLVGGLFYGLAMLVYFFSDVRLYFPLMVLAIPVMAVVSVDWATSLARRRAWFRLAGTVLLAAAALWGIPGKTRRAELTEMLKLSKLRHTGVEYKLTQRFMGLRGDDRALILSNMDPPYVHALTNPDDIAAPLQNDHSYRFNPEVFRFQDEERLELVKRKLEEGLAVWFIAMWNPTGLDESLLPTPPGHSWRMVYGSPDEGHIGRLEPDGGEEPENGRRRSGK